MLVLNSTITIFSQKRRHRIISLIVSFGLPLGILFFIKVQRKLYLAIFKCHNCFAFSTRNNSFFQLAIRNALLFLSTRTSPKVLKINTFSLVSKVTSLHICKRRRYAKNCFRQNFIVVGISSDSLTLLPFFLLTLVIAVYRGFEPW